MFVVNFVSGKGGTGKTLVACVLAELLSSSKTSVLLIDLDVFVRGLTSLLYFKDQSMLNLKEKDAFSVSDILQYDGDRTTLKLGISRYRSFDVLPSVPRIDSILRYQDIMPDDFETAKGILEEILTNHKVQEYDVVILDSRAGFDEFIAATHMVADCSICVEEDDEVAQVTSANLIQQLDELRGSGNVYTLTNKSWKEGERRMRSLGHIPFDMDVMKTYGYEMFWPKIMKSLLEPSIVDAWNTLCRNERQVFFLKSRRVSPFPWGEMEKYTTRMLTYERLLFFYGLFIGTLGIGVGIAGVDFIYKVLDDPTRIFALSVGIAGIVIALLGIVRK